MAAFIRGLILISSHPPAQLETLSISSTALRPTGATGGLLRPLALWQQRRAEDWLPNFESAYQSSKNSTKSMAARWKTMTPAQSSP